VVEVAVKAGQKVELSATGCLDPDGNAVKLTWFIYLEAGTYGGDVRLSALEGARTELVAPAVKQPQTIHVILQVQDNGAPSLFAYRRAVITVSP
jgi:hypothetical protein